MPVGDERVALVLPVLSQAQSLPVLCGTVEREGAALPELSQLSLLSPVLPLTAQPASQGGGVHGLRALAGRQWAAPSPTKAVSRLSPPSATEERTTGAAMLDNSLLDGAVEFSSVRCEPGSFSGDSGLHSSLHQP